ncbi:MAG: hypothetical protein QNL04_03655 [SAR324 cluster bacterium]|nr:hypothetical protein [SAR324 cluster bacterium]
MALLKKKQQTTTERLLKLVADGKAHLNKELGKEIKQQLEDFALAAQKALTTKHTVDLERLKAQVKALKEENSHLSSQLKGKNKILDKINKLAAK